MGGTAGGHDVTGGPGGFNGGREARTGRFGGPRAAHLTWQPRTTVDVDERHAETLLKLLDVLDDNDDVQQVAANFEIADAVMTRLTA